MGTIFKREQKEITKAQQREIFKWLFKMIFSMNAFRRYVASASVSDKVDQMRFYESASLFTRKSFSVMSGLGNLIKERKAINRNYPLLILAGDKDLDLAKKSATQWHRDESGSQFYIIEHAGHCANMDNPTKLSIDNVLIRGTKSHG